LEDVIHHVFSERTEKSIWGVCILKVGVLEVNEQAKALYERVGFVVAGGDDGWDLEYFFGED